MKYLNSAQRIGTRKEIMYNLVDFSPSMDEPDYAPTRKVGALEANKRLIESKAKLYPQDMLGLIAFDGNAHILHSHTSVGEGCQNLCDSLDNTIDEIGGTNFTAALKLAGKCLFPEYADNGFQNPLLKILRDFFVESQSKNSSARPAVSENITRRIILLTDGDHNGGGSPIKVAERLKNAGVIIECIGIAGRPKDVDEKMLKKIASTDKHGNPMYCFIGDTNSLIQKYEKIAGHLRPA